MHDMAVTGKEQIALLPIESSPFSPSNLSWLPCGELRFDCEPRVQLRLVAVSNTVSSAQAREIELGTGAGVEAMS